jgi:hypothetical protein
MKKGRKIGIEGRQDERGIQEPVETKRNEKAETHS